MRRDGAARAAGCLVCLTAAVGLGPSPAAAQPEAAPEATNPRLRKYDSPYYVIYTDHKVEVVREAYLRLTAMAEEYYRRTRSFGGRIQTRLPFYLFSNYKDFQAAGGGEDAAGVFLDDRLMAVLEKDRAEQVWGVVQHEGFHQFAHYAISEDLPVWVDEGLAEYFGQGIWTGDGFVTGVVPRRRMRQVQRYIRNGEMLPMAQLLTMTHERWGVEMSDRNYDQAWATVHFLVHGDDGRHRQAFVGWLSDLSRKRPWAEAFRTRFGRDLAALEKRCTEWWTSLPEYPTGDLYVQVVVETLTSFLARGCAMGRKFGDVEEFFAAARDGKLAADPMKQGRFWLPPALLDRALRYVPVLKVWSLQTDKGPPKLTLQRPGGTTFVGTFSFRSDGRPTVRVYIQHPKPAKPAAAR